MNVLQSSITPSPMTATAYAACPRFMPPIGGLEHPRRNGLTPVPRRPLHRRAIPEPHHRSRRQPGDRHLRLVGERLRQGQPGLATVEAVLVLVAGAITGAGNDEVHLSRDPARARLEDGRRGL